MMKVWSVRNKFSDVGHKAQEGEQTVFQYISGIEIVFIPISVLDGARQFVSHKKSI
jgi:hypothetical protein